MRRWRNEHSDAEEEFQQLMIEQQEQVAEHEEALEHQQQETLTAKQQLAQV